MSEREKLDVIDAKVGHIAHQFKVVENELTRLYEVELDVEEWQKLAADLLDAFEMLASQITVVHLDCEVNDDEMQAICSRFVDRFRALAPDYPGILPMESPDRNDESTAARIKRLIGEVS